VLAAIQGPHHLLRGAQIAEHDIVWVRWIDAQGCCGIVVARIWWGWEIVWQRRAAEVQLAPPSCETLTINRPFVPSMSMTA
jgi:hypothetical protein